MMTRALIENGASKVYILGRRLNKLQETAASISPNVVPVQCDVTSKADLQRAAEQVEREVGYMNLLVCNSGITGPSPGVQMSENVTLDEFVDKNFAIDFDEYTNTFAVNVTAVWFTAMAFLRLLDKGNQQSGDMERKSQVIVTSSLASYNKKAPAGYAYGQSKAAATHAMKHLANQLPKFGIRLVGFLNASCCTAHTNASNQRFVAQMPFCLDVSISFTVFLDASKRLTACSVPERNVCACAGKVQDGDWRISQRALVHGTAQQARRRKGHGRNTSLFGVARRRLLQRRRTSGRRRPPR